MFRLAINQVHSLPIFRPWKTSKHEGSKALDVILSQFEFQSTQPFPPLLRPLRPQTGWRRLPSRGQRDGGGGERAAGQEISLPPVHQDGLPETQGGVQEVGRVSL